jgi:hypothetical protein
MTKNKISLQKKKSDLKKLVSLMNKQNKRFIPPFDPILKTIDLVITEEELNLLLMMGTDLYSYEQVAALSNMNSEKFNSIFESLKQKAFIGIKYTETSEERYTLNHFLVGWFEGQVTYLIGKPEEKEFARRYMEFYDSLRNRNFFPLRNIMNIMAKRAPVSNQSVGMIHESNLRMRRGNPLSSLMRQLMCRTQRFIQQIPLMILSWNMEEKVLLVNSKHVCVGGLLPTLMIHAALKCPTTYHAWVSAMQLNRI